MSGSKTYEISSEWFTAFKIEVDKNGLVIWCSDNSHPVGAVWKTLRQYYESKTGELKCEIKEIKDNE